MDPDSTSRPYDITILYMQDALEWCEYLFDLFSPYDVSQNSENITEFPTQEGTIQAIKSSFVRIAIVSPAFLERCSSELEHVVADRPVVGLLCGVSKTDLGVLELRLPSHKSWTLADAQEDPKSLTQTTMKVLDDAWKDETDSLYLPMVGSIQLAAGDPEEQEDLYVDGTVTAPDSNLYDLTDTYDILTVVPERIPCNSKKKFYILFPTDSLKEENAYLVRVSGSESSMHVEATAVNPYVLCVCPPKDILPGSVTMEITCDGSIIGNCSATIVSHLDQLVEHLKSSLEPMTVMCESLGISPASINQLDNILYEHVNSIQNSNMLKDALTSSQDGKQTKSDKLYPTALHFAASFGLKNITNYLLGLPGADHAGTIRNRDNLNPSEMAKKNGHDQLADIMSYPVHKDAKSGGYVTMVPGSRPEYDRPRPRDTQASDLIDEGGSIYKLYFPEMSQLRRHDDEDEPESYEPIQVIPLPGPALPSRMNPTSPLPSPQSAPDERVTSVDDVAASQKELFEIDQQILKKEITNAEAHKRFEQWRRKYMDKMTAAGPTPRNVPPHRANVMTPRQASDVLREQRTQSTISRPILATSHSVPQTTSTPYLRACSGDSLTRRIRARSEPLVSVAGFVPTIGNDPPSSDSLKSDRVNLPGNPPSGPRGPNRPPKHGAIVPTRRVQHLQSKRLSASLHVAADMAPTRPPPPIPSSSPPRDLPNRPPPPPPNPKPPVGSRSDSQGPPAPPVRLNRHPPVPAPRH